MYVMSLINDDKNYFKTNNIVRIKTNKKSNLNVENIF